MLQVWPATYSITCDLPAEKHNAEFAPRKVTQQFFSGKCHLAPRVHSLPERAEPASQYTFAYTAQPLCAPLFQFGVSRQPPAASVAVSSVVAQFSYGVAKPGGHRQLSGLSAASSQQR